MEWEKNIILQYNFLTITCFILKLVQILYFQLYYCIGHVTSYGVIHLFYGSLNSQIYDGTFLYHMHKKNEKAETKKKQLYLSKAFVLSSLII